MNVRQYRTTEQDVEMMHALRMRTMRRYDLTLEQVVRHHLDEPSMEEHARATLAADVKRQGTFEKEAMQRFRAHLARRYDLTVRQVVQGGLDRPLMDESARETLVAEIKRVQSRRMEPKKRASSHCERVVPGVRPMLQVLSA